MLREGGGWQLSVTCLLLVFVFFLSPISPALFFALIYELLHSSGPSGH